MRVLPLLLSALLLQGCVATERLQHQTIQSIDRTNQQCRILSDRITTLQLAHQDTDAEILNQRRYLTRLEKKVTPKIVPIPSPQECEPVTRKEKGVDNKIVVGEVEWALMDYGGYFKAQKARMDTGATTSSISASEISDFERNGERWVRFKLEDGTELSKPLERVARISQASAQSDRRRIIRLGIKMGDITQTAEFSLKDRSHLKYEVLIGRNLLRDLLVVDVANRYMLGGKPKVPKQKKPKSSKSNKDKVTDEKSEDAKSSDDQSSNGKKASSPEPDKKKPSGQSG